MRLWHYQLLPYLPELQFKGQQRELVAVMRDWRDKKTTNHLLINRMMEYPKQDLGGYFLIYREEYQRRYGKDVPESINAEFYNFCEGSSNKPPFKGWHNKEYLRICMSNLFEKHKYGIGKSRITDEEWQRLCDGYKAITGEEYRIQRVEMKTCKVAKSNQVGETSSKYGYSNGADLFLADCRAHEQRVEFLWGEFVSFMKSHDVKPAELRSMFTRYYEEFIK